MDELDRLRSVEALHIHLYLSLSRMVFPNLTSSAFQVGMVLCAFLSEPMLHCVRLVVASLSQPCSDLSTGVHFLLDSQQPEGEKHSMHYGHLRFLR